MCQLQTSFFSKLTQININTNPNEQKQTFKQPSPLHFHKIGQSMALQGTSSALRR